MYQPERKFHVRDTVLLTGWLFADLLLGLTVIFLAAVPGAPPRKVVLLVNPQVLNLNQCGNDYRHPKCTIQLSETKDSQGPVDWQASSDMDGTNNTVQFSPLKGTLLPGKSKSITISNIPCQNGSFTFRGSAGAAPVTVLWHCTPPPVRLETGYEKLMFNNVDYQGLIDGSSIAKMKFEAQVISRKELQGRRVGLAIAYGGAPTDNDIGTAYQIADAVYSALMDLGNQGFAFQNSSYYGHLYNLRTSSTIVEVDVYLFEK